MHFDAPATHQSWAEDEGFRFGLWTDDDGRLALHFGAASSVTAPTASRLTVVIGPEAMPVLEEPNVSVVNHPAEVLEDLTILYGERRKGR